MSSKAKKIKSESKKKVKKVMSKMSEQERYEMAMYLMDEIVRLDEMIDTLKFINFLHNNKNDKF